MTSSPQPALLSTRMRWSCAVLIIVAWALLYPQLFALENSNPLTSFSFLRPAATTMQPTLQPTLEPTLEPTLAPTLEPTPQPPTVPLVTLAPTQPTIPPPTRSPTKSPTAFSADYCREHVPAPPPTRQVPSWSTCAPSSLPPIPAHLVEDLTTHPLDDEGFIIDLASHHVHYFAGGNWGQMCNKLSMFAGMLHNMTAGFGEAGMLTKIWALNSDFSPVAWTLDLDLLTSKVHGVFLDCTGCDSGYDDHDYLRCGSYVGKSGVVYNASQLVIPVYKNSHVIHLYHLFRPKEAGYMEELNSVLQPAKALRFLVERAMAQFDTENGGDGGASVGIHQRGMDGLCYRWLGEPVEYNCHPRADMSVEFTQLGMEGAFFPGTGHYSWGNFNVRPEFHRDGQAFEMTVEEIEKQYPLAAVCNYSLSQAQMDAFRISWPVLSESKLPLRILLATDGQSPRAEKVMRRASYAKVSMLKDFDQCLTGFKFYDMLADMLAMSMTDLHMANPLSSCDDIVVHWRRARGKKKGTSFPVGCYDAYLE